MSKARPKHRSHSRKKAPDDLVIPVHRYKDDAKTRAAIALAATIPLAPGPPQREARKGRRAKAKKRAG